MKPTPKSLSRQTGVALIASLIIMLVMTLIALSAMRGTTTYEKIAGSSREKQRAFQVAQDTLEYGEYWLNANGGTTAAVDCTKIVNFTKPQICLTALPAGTPATSLNLYSGYKPTSMPVNSTGGNATSGDINYASYPGLYLAVSSTTPYNPGGVTMGPVFQVTAIGYGGTTGNNQTVAIVQSIYQLSASGSSGASSAGNSLGGP